MKIAYITKRFSAKSRKAIEQANAIIAEYQAEGFLLTLRQLYYQFVARGWSENTVAAYKRIGTLVNDGRLAGLIDWDAIEDRTRAVRALPHWGGPSEIVTDAAKQYQTDKWAGQQFRPEVWIEKEALAGVIERTCQELDVPFLSCRGYTSQSEMHGSAKRIEDIAAVGQTPIIFHFGDHDPSGIDMTRDIIARMELFMDGVQVNRLALNMDQIEQFHPPPNPAKVTDTRFRAYAVRFGEDSWELDALDPRTLTELITEAVLAVRDEPAWEKAVKTENKHRRALERVAADLEKKAT